MPTPKFIAGGTNLVDLMKRGVMAPQKLVDINSLPLTKIEHQNGSLRIGALALNGPWPRISWCWSDSRCWCRP